MKLANCSVKQSEQILTMDQLKLTITKITETKFANRNTYNCGRRSESRYFCHRKHSTARLYHRILERKDRISNRKFQSGNFETVSEFFLSRQPT